jgi:hypothetical protein
MDNNIWDQLRAIKKDLDAIEMQLEMNTEAIESVEMELRFLQTELDYEARGNSSAG